MADQSISKADLEKELSKDAHVASIQKMQIDKAKSWNAGEAAEYARRDVNHHTELEDEGDKQVPMTKTLRADMIINVRENSAYREALEVLSPALMLRVEKEAAEALEERKRREAMLAAAGVAANAAADKVAESAPAEIGGGRDADREHLTGRDVAAGAAHVAQLAEVGGPGVQVAAQAVGIADAAKVASDVASGKDVRALDAATAAASVTMTAGVGGAAVQAGAKAVAVAGALDAGERAANTAGDAVAEADAFTDVLKRGGHASATSTNQDLSDDLRAMLKNPISPEDAIGEIQGRRSINANHDSLKTMTRDSLTSERAGELALADARALRSIQDKGERQAAAAVMAANATNQAAYKTQLMRQDPEMSLEVDASGGEPVALDKPVSEADKAAAASATAAALASPATGKAAVRTDDKEENTVDVQRKGAELERGEFIMPRRITQAYTEHDGKFFAKDTSRMMFHDQGEKLATSTTDKAAIADMVAYAKAKQWESLKLTGSQEFRREAWLQAESQGIKTQGFTPREKDLVELKTLTMERATNSITPLQDRAKDRAPLEQPVVAPRHDLNKNQAATASAAAQNSTTNIKELQKDPAMERFSMEDLAKIAFYRALIVEREKASPQAVRDEAVAKFDKTMRDPAMVKALPDPEIKAERPGAAKDKEHKRDTPELSL